MKHIKLFEDYNKEKYVTVYYNKIFISVKK